MSEPIDLARFMRIARKRKEKGRGALDDGERASYHECMRTLRPFVERLSEAMDHPGFKAYERLSPEDQMRYSEWKPEQLMAFLPLIQDDEREDGDA